MGNSRKFKIGDNVCLNTNGWGTISSHLGNDDYGVTTDMGDNIILTHKYLEKLQRINKTSSIKGIEVDSGSSIQKAIDYLERLKGSEALDNQVGGKHYKKYLLQPAIFHRMNNLRQAEANVIDYILRAKDKNGKEDLDKAIHWIEMIKDMDYEQ